MNITFRLPVVVTAVPGRMRDPRTVVGYVPVSASIPVIEGFDAPVAFSYKSYSGGLGTRHEFRSHGGRFYHPIDAVPSETVSAAFLDHYGYKTSAVADDGLMCGQLLKVREVVRRGKGNREGASTLYPKSFADYAYSLVGSYEFEPILEMPLKGDYEAEIVEQVDAFRRKIEGLVVIDGGFHFPEPEPVLALTDSFGPMCKIRRASEIPGTSIGTGTGREIDVIGYFRLDEEDRMREEARRLTRTDNVSIQYEELEVHDGSCLSAPVEALTLAEAGAAFARYFVTTLVGDGEEEVDAPRRHLLLAESLAALPPQQLTLYQSLARGVAAVRGGGPADELEEAVTRIMDAGPASLEWFHFVFRGNVARQAEGILRRWNDREIGFDADVAASPSPR